MTKKRKRLLGIVIGLLILVSGALIIGDEHERHMKDAYIEIVLTPRASGEVAGPLMIDQSTCRYLLPTFYNILLHWVTCYECVIQAREINRIYTIAPMKESCPARGAVSMTFIRR